MAYVQTLTFDYNINSSLQIGDQVYMTNTSSLGGFDQNLNSTPIHVGEVLNILSSTEIEVYSVYVDSIGNALPYNQPTGGEYISFSKNRVVNNNDLLGYYASVNFVNDSPYEAKLWSTASVVTENSK